jgi:Ion channel
MHEAKLSKTEDGTATRREARATAGLFRFSAANLLVALILLLVLYPFVMELEHGEVIESSLMMIILISAVVAVSGRSRVLAVLLLLPALAGPWMEHYMSAVVPYWTTACARMVFVAFVVIQLLRFILRSTRVNSEVMCAGISGYLLLGIWWTSAYLAVSQLNPAAFAGIHLTANQPLGRFDALYFSFVSLTCLGCADITPQSKVARMLLMTESTTGVLYLAVLIARLVALYSRSADKGHDQQN